MESIKNFAGRDEVTTFNSVRLVERGWREREESIRRALLVPSFDLLLVCFWSSSSRAETCIHQDVVEASSLSPHLLIIPPIA